MSQVLVQKNCAWGYNSL